MTLFLKSYTVSHPAPKYDPMIQVSSECWVAKSILDASGFDYSSLTDGPLTSAAGPCSPDPPSSQRSGPCSAPLEPTGLGEGEAPPEREATPHDDDCECFDCFLAGSGSRSAQMGQ